VGVFIDLSTLPAIAERQVPQVTYNKLYTITKGENDTEGQMIRVKPTEYLLSLEPQHAIVELKGYVESVSAELEECSKKDLDIPENVEKVRSLMFDAEIAQGYLAQVFKAWQAKQQAQPEDSGQ
jgi:hypothetical protein